ncbi:hypothetical protein [Magnetococcus marinus]|uniref:hypothetical protein n=1 Tax=Magnetococcus marinus TaxID=1124597 RepID=UPI00059FF0B4|nr:hypothetical protein [Magnetococcus marinus]
MRKTTTAIIVAASLCLVATSAFAGRDHKSIILEAWGQGLTKMKLSGYPLSRATVAKDRVGYEVVIFNSLNGRDTVVCKHEASKWLCVK